MSKAIELQSSVQKHINFVLNDEDEQGNPVSTTYKLVYNYAAIKRAEDSTGVDLKSFESWKNIKSSMTPALVHAGMAKYHPDVTLEYIADRLSPDVQRPLQDALFDYLFPGVMEQVKKIQEAKGETASPNVGGVEPDASKVSHEPGKTSGQ
jgi:hypothetical protein